MANALWFCGIFIRRNPALLAIVAAGLATIAALTFIPTTGALEPLKWLLFWSLVSGRAIHALPAAIASRQFGRLLPGAGAEMRRWTILATAVSIAVFAAIYGLCFNAAPFWLVVLLIAGCHFVAARQLLYYVAIVALVAAPAPAFADANQALSAAAAVLAIAVGIRYVLPFNRPWESPGHRADNTPGYERLSDWLGGLKLVRLPGAAPAENPGSRPAIAVDFESFGHAPLPGVRNPLLFALIGAAALALALAIGHAKGSGAVVVPLLNLLGTAALLLGLVCALYLRPTRLQLTLDRRSLWRAVSAATLRTALTTGAILGIIALVAAAAAGVDDPFTLARLALTILVAHLLFMTGIQWAYLHVPATELVECAIPRARGLPWSVLWRELLVLLFGGAGVVLVYFFPAAFVGVALVAIAANAFVLRNHYLHADLI
jgi:hypothetical protein